MLWEKFPENHNKKANALILTLKYFDDFKKGEIPDVVRKDVCDAMISCANIMLGEITNNFYMLYVACILYMSRNPNFQKQSDYNMICNLLRFKMLSDEEYEALILDILEQEAEDLYKSALSDIKGEGEKNKVDFSKVPFEIPDFLRPRSIKNDQSKFMKELKKYAVFKKEK